MDSDNLIFVNILKHLPKSDQSNAIRSNLMQRYMGSVNVSHFEQLCLCRVCGNNYLNMPMPLHQNLEPPKKINRFLRRLIKRKPDYGTKFQMKALKKILKSKNKQTLVKICRFCKINKIKISCQKPVKRLQRERNSELKYTDEVRKSVFKKAKKSSQFAGLNKAAVLAVKRAGEDINLDMHTAKRQKLDSSIIVLDTPLNSSSNSEKSNTNHTNLKISGTNKNSPGHKHSKQSKLKKVRKTNAEHTPKKSKIMDLDKSVVCINDTPTPKKKTKEPDFINLVTPKRASPTTNSVNLITPVTNKSIATSPLKSKSPKIKKNKKTKSNPSSPNKKNISNFLKKTEDLDKTISNLQQFLKSIT